MIYLIYGFVGLIAGGIINALSDDLPARRKPALPHCYNDKCSHTYGPAGWLAIGRYLFNGGKCPECGIPERLRPILTEVSTALILGLLPLFISDQPHLAITAFYLCVLILIIVIDMEHKLILHVVTFPSTAIAILGLSWLLPDNNMRLAAVGALAGFGFFFILFWIGERVFGAGALGFGDVTLSMTMGAMLGFALIFPTLIIGILLGGILSGALLVLRIVNRESYIPYGPFLAVAGMIMLIWGQQIIDWYWSVS